MTQKTNINVKTQEMAEYVIQLLQMANSVARNNGLQIAAESETGTLIIIPDDVRPGIPSKKTPRVTVTPIHTSVPLYIIDEDDEMVKDK